MISKLEEVLPYAKKNPASRDDLWTDREEVRTIIAANPLESEEVAWQVSSIIVAVDGIINWTLEENYTLTLWFWDMLSMEPNITERDKNNLDAHLTFLENWWKSKLSIKSDKIIH
jgi:hypothetical protein